MLGVLAHLLADAGSSTFQVGNNPTTYLGGTGIVAVMGFVFRLATKIIERGDTRDARQWKQVEFDLKRKDEEIERISEDRDLYRDRWLECIQGRKEPAT